MSEIIKESKKSIFESIGEMWGVAEVDPKKLYDTLKATAFKPIKKGNEFVQVTEEQLLALMIVSKQYNLNPFLKEIYAFPAKDGSIVPVVGVDGWAKIINDHPQMDGLEFNYSDKTTSPPGGQECPIWIECVIHRKDRSKPIIAREYLDECYRKENYTGPWQTHTKRFLRHKALIQAGRLAFGFSNIYDQDEATRIVEAKQEIGLAQKGYATADQINEEYLNKKKAITEIVEEAIVLTPIEAESYEAEPVKRTRGMKDMVVDQPENLFEAGGIWQNT